jgi:hypothetical protein
MSKINKCLTLNEVLKLIGSSEKDQSSVKPICELIIY